MPPTRVTAYPMLDPAAGVPPRAPWLRAAWRLGQDLRAAIGLRRSFRAADNTRVYFKETTTVPLPKALAMEGGVKEYRVTFPDGSKQYIQCSPARVYADAMGPLLLPPFQLAAGMIRPGSRVLCLPGGTGYAPSWLGRHVGRSGAVVSVEPDKESVLFAQKRYGAPNIAFELGGIESLRGEIDGSFDAVMSITHHTIDPSADAAHWRELWRVTAPGGWMLIGRAGVSAAELLERVRAVAVVTPHDSPGAPAVQAAAEVLSGAPDVVTLAIARRPQL